MWKAASLILMNAAVSAANLESDQEIVNEFRERSGLRCDDPIISDWSGELRYRGIFVFTGANVIYLRSGLEAGERRRVLIHELAHCGLRTRNLGFHQEEMMAQNVERALAEGFYQEKALSCYGDCVERNSR